MWFHKTNLIIILFHPLKIVYNENCRIKKNQSNNGTSEKFNHINYAKDFSPGFINFT